MKTYENFTIFVLLEDGFLAKKTTRPEKAGPCRI
jgi:hypothetical protein